MTIPEYENWLNMLSDEEVSYYEMQYDGDFRRAYDEEVASIVDYIHDMNKDDELTERSA